MNASKQQPRVELDPERKAFEQWYRRRHFAYASDLKQDRTEHGYRSPYIDGAWMGWRGARENRA